MFQSFDKLFCSVSGRRRVVGMVASIAPRKMLEFPALDLSPFDRFGLTPLDDAIRHGHVPVQKLLGIRLGRCLGEGA